MSKNTLNTAYRKIDVDAIEAETFEPEGTDDSAGPNESDVSAMLSQWAPALVFTASLPVS